MIIEIGPTVFLNNCIQGHYVSKISYEHQFYTLFDFRRC